MELREVRKIFEAKNDRKTRARTPEEVEREAVFADLARRIIDLSDSDSPVIREREDNGENRWFPKKVFDVMFPDTEEGANDAVGVELTVGMSALGGPDNKTVTGIDIKWWEANGSQSSIHESVSLNRLHDIPEDTDAMLSRIDQTLTEVEAYSAAS
jgi:hypothetical protein